MAPDEQTRLAELEYQVRDLRKDINSLQTLHSRMEGSIVKLDGASNKLDNMTTVQERTLISLESMLSKHSEDQKKEISDLSARTSGFLTDHETRIRNLETWRWITAGAIAFALFMLPIIKEALVVMFRN